MPEAAPAAPMRAWVMGYGRLGLINVVAGSQTELVARIRKLRNRAGLNLQANGSNALESFEVLGNNPGAPERMTIWLNPLLIQAVLNEFTPGPAGAGELGLPPGLAAVLAKIGQSEPEAEEDVTEVVVGLDDPGLDDPDD